MKKSIKKETTAMYRAAKLNLAIIKTARSEKYIVVQTFLISRNAYSLGLVTATMTVKMSISARPKKKNSPARLTPRFQSEYIK
jgi:hypothetical protein